MTSVLSMFGDKSDTQVEAWNLGRRRRLILCPGLDASLNVYGWEVRA